MKRTTVDEGTQTDNAQFVEAQKPSTTEAITQTTEKRANIDQGTQTDNARLLEATQNDERRLSADTDVESTMKQHLTQVEQKRGFSLRLKCAPSQQFGGLALTQSRPPFVDGPLPAPAPIVGPTALACTPIVKVPQTLIWPPPRRGIIPTEAPASPDVRPWAFSGCVPPSPDTDADAETEPPIKRQCVQDPNQGFAHASVCCNQYTRTSGTGLVKYVSLAKGGTNEGTQKDNVQLEEWNKDERAIKALVGWLGLVDWCSSESSLRFQQSGCFAMDVPCCSSP